MNTDIVKKIKELIETNLFGGQDYFKEELENNFNLKYEKDFYFEQDDNTFSIVLTNDFDPEVRFTVYNEVPSIFGGV